MSSINWNSLIAGVLTVGSAVSVAAGHPAIGAVISNPEVATALTAVVGGVAGLWSMFAPALLHSTTTAAAIKIAAK
jgi:hypothetical protein